MAFFFGGSTCSNSLVEGENSLLSYNCTSDQWKCLGSNENLDPLRKFHAATNSKEGMFIYGGLSQQKPLGDIWFFDFKFNSWKQILCRSQCPPPRYGHTLDYFENHLYSFGGYSFINDKFNYTNDLYIFNTGKLQ